MFWATSPQAVADSTTPVDTVPTASAVSFTRAGDLLGDDALLFHGRGDRGRGLVDLADRFAHLADRADRFAGRTLDVLDSVANVLGRAGRLASQFLDLGGHHGEALAGFARTGRLDRGIQSEQVGLLGNVLDHLDHLADFFGGGAELADRLVATLGQGDRRVGDAGGLLGRLGDFADAGWSAR